MAKKKIEKTEAKINWREDAQNIIAKINALNPNPGCWFEIDGSRIKIIKAKKIICDGKPGIVLDEKFTIDNKIFKEKGFIKLSIGKKKHFKIVN